VAVACEAAAPLPADSERAGIALGTACGSHLSNELYWRGARGPAGPSPSIFAYTLPSAATAEASMALALKGPTLTLASGRCSGVAALIEASSSLAAGACDWMLAGAVDVLSPTLLLAREGDLALHRGASGGREQGDLTPPRGASGGREQGEVLAEAAALAVLDHAREGAVARVAGAGQAHGEHAVERAVAAALERSGLAAGALRRRADGSGGGLVLGDAQAAAPLLEAWAALAAGELPCLVLGADARGGAAALCLVEP